MCIPPVGWVQGECASIAVVIVITIITITINMEKVIKMTIMREKSGN